MKEDDEEESEEGEDSARAGLHTGFVDFAVDLFNGPRFCLASHHCLAQRLLGGDTCGVLCDDLCGAACGDDCARFLWFTATRMLSWVGSGW